MTAAPETDDFAQQVRLIRDIYAKKRDSTNLFPSTGRRLISTRKDIIDDILYYTFWYEHGDCAPQCLRLADLAGTLSGDILRLNRNLPKRGGDYEIVGDQIRPLERPLPLSQEEPDDTDDLDQILNILPVVQVDPSKRFTKRCTPISEHVIQLLGKSPDGKLVFEKFTPRYFVLGRDHPLSTYLDWTLQLISGLKSLHQLGIVHRDLRIDNLVFSGDNSNIVIIDLESHWGIRQAPEISREPTLGAGWDEKSDIYDLGDVIRHMVLGNAPIIDRVEIPVPSPMNVSVEACKNPSPEKRPSLDELYQIVSNMRQELRRN